MVKNNLFILPFFLLLTFLITIPAAFGQDEDPGVAAFKKKVEAKLKTLSEEEVKALDKRLAEALSYYYQEDYGKAFSLFEEISQTVETLDLMFWAGTSAAKAGKIKTAEEKFKKMLSISPNLNRVRLELADLYLATGRLDEAKKEFLRVKKANPPQAVAKNIENRLKLIQSKRGAKKTLLNISASVGYQYDDNITAGPDTDQISLSSGSLTLASDERKKDSNNIVGKVRASLRHDIGSKGGLFLYAGLNHYNLYVPGENQFNYMSTDLSAGPWILWPKAALKLPVGYRDTRYGDVYLSTIIHFDPSFEYRLKKNLSLSVSGSFHSEDYNDASEGYDNTETLFTIGPRFYLKGKKHIITPAATFGYHGANRKSSSYSVSEFSISYFTRLFYGIEFFAKYRFTQRNYEDNPPLFDEDRDDDRHTISAVLSRRFLKHFIASFEFLYMENDSNAALYDFSKTSYTFNIGVTF